MPRLPKNDIPGNDGNIYKCPICKTYLPNVEIATFPFCSDQCRLLDLSKWLDGSYTTHRPVDPGDPVEELPKTNPGATD